MASALALPTDLTICSVGEVRANWLAWLDAIAHASADPAGACCDVDAAAVGEVDAAGVQLLLALENALAHRQLTLRLADPSAALIHACESLGVAHLLGATAQVG